MQRSGKNGSATASLTPGPRELLSIFRDEEAFFLIRDMMRLRCEMMKLRAEVRRLKADIDHFGENISVIRSNIAKMEETLSKIENRIFEHFIEEVDQPKAEFSMGWFPLLLVIVQVLVSSILLLVLVH